MGHKFAKDLTLQEAKNAADALISNINEFVSSIEQVFPNQGYDELVLHLNNLNIQIQNCNGPFLDLNTADLHVNELLITFTSMNATIEPQLKDFFEAHKEIATFLDQHQNAIEYKLLDFDPIIIKKMGQINTNSNLIFSTLKQKNYTDTVALHGLFSIHSSRIETSEESFLEELRKYRDAINLYAKKNSIAYKVKFDPVKVCAVGGMVKRKNGRYYTEGRAIRHLLVHNHYELNNISGCTIHFKSPDNDPDWQFYYDRIFTCEDFANLVAQVDLFYKTAVNLLFTFQLLGVLRQCFIIKK